MDETDDRESIAWNRFSTATTPNTEGNAMELDVHQTNWNEKTAAHVIKNLEKRRMTGSYAPTSAQAKTEILQMIPPGASVYRCGSMTAVYMGLWEEIEKIERVRVINPYRTDLTAAEAYEMRRKGLTADFMIAGSNAVTLDGRLVNLDGTGNRVAAMAFGPNKVILVVGMNKVVSNLEAAQERVKHYAAPVNAMRVPMNPPCTETGLCTDCKSPHRICNMWSIIEGHIDKGRIHVKLIGETLGY
jgi:hypothetical protein